MKNKWNKKLFMFLVSIVIWSVLTIIWGWVWYHYYADVIQLPFYRRGNWVVVGIYGFLIFLITQFYGGYRVGFYRRGDVIFSGIMSMIITNGITYLQTSLVGRQFMNVRPLFWMSVVDFVLIWIWATWANILYMKVNPPRHLLVVYGGSRMAQSLISKMIDRDDKYIIQEAVNIEEGFHTILPTIDRYMSVLICDVKSGHRNRLLKYCYERNIRVYMTPKISDILIRGASEIHLFDSPLLLTRNEGLRLEQRLFKRAIDIIFAGIGLIVFSPFMIFIGLAIKIEDRGPVIYSQDRLTQGGQVFRLHKFRSMIVNAEETCGARLAGNSDDRVTRVGRIIRRVRFDEIPQFLNIIKGDMSLVGPRPERPEIAAEYRKTMAEFDFRLKVKAGLTGYAQVIGKYNTTPYDKLKLDLMYITGYSFLLDIQLILQTVKTLFRKGSTEGIQDGTKTAGEDVR